MVVSGMLFIVLVGTGPWAPLLPLPISGAAVAP